MKRCPKVGFAVVGLGAIAQGSVLPAFRHTKQAKLVALVSCEKPLDLRKMYSCPESERAAYQEAVWFPHQNFLGSSEDTDTIADDREGPRHYRRAAWARSQSHTESEARARGPRKLAGFLTKGRVSCYLKITGSLSLRGAVTFLRRTSAYLEA